MFLLLATPSFAEVSLNATGNEWINYSDVEKIVLMTSIFFRLEVDAKKYSIEKAVSRFDFFYEMAEETEGRETFYKRPCWYVFKRMVIDVPHEEGLAYMEREESEK